MGLSRWGARAEAALNAPVPEKTFSETITDVVLESERKDTVRLLFEGIGNLIASHFALETMEIVYDAACNWYVVKARRQVSEGVSNATIIKDGKPIFDAIVVINIRDEDIARNCVSAPQWKAFLEATCRRMMRELRMQTSQNIPAIFASLEAQTEHFSDVMSRLAVEVNEFGVAFARVGELEEQEAIDSIMRSIEAQSAE